MSTTNLQQRLQDLFRYVREGRILDAMNEFYDKDTVMQENANPPTKGLAANIEREKQFLSMVKEWKGFDVPTTGVGDGVTFYENSVDFIATDGKPVHMEQVAVQKWRNGKIVHERFYYDTAGAHKA
jgi:ketosteroid isomerase-like protein